MTSSRRDFLKFLGRAGLLSLSAGFVTACAPKSAQNSGENIQSNASFKPLAASLNDKLELAEGFDYQLLIKWQDAISDKDRFGTHNDYLAYIPTDKNTPNEGLLWVNHEYLKGIFVSGFDESVYENKTRAHCEQEMYEVGGSILKIRKNTQTQKWEFVPNDPLNRRLTAQTMIPFAWKEPIAGKNQAMGTFANCAGGVTPWGTVLTCEENYDMFYGETDYKDPTRPKHIPAYYYGWDIHFPENRPEHYGWVVEVDLKTGAAKKLVALGRCAHECATTSLLADGRTVVYTGDDSNNEHLYKFISDTPNSLETGTLYVANIEAGEWRSLDFKTQPALQKHFKSQTEVLIRLREAAKLVGATPLDRPEDIEIDPLTGAVFVTLTNNKPKGNYLGQILKIEEAGGDKASLKFKSAVFMTGGEETGFACPDNIAFDKKGNLWFASDISGEAIGKAPYTSFGNNSIFVVPVSGADAGKVLRVASAPKDAEFTGLCFLPDNQSLLVCVQHPGETSPSKTQLTSHFPEGGDSIPKSSVVVITGKTLEKIIQ
jgi:secreted PhoX family phosphatase